MIEIQCPRCLQYWYSEEEVTGRAARLCPTCGIHKQARKRRGVTMQLGVFAVVAAVLLVVDGAWITLAALWPDPFGPAMLIYGGVLLFPSALWISAVLRMARLSGEMDWTIHRWPLLVGLMGLACILAYFSMQKHGP